MPLPNNLPGSYPCRLRCAENFIESALVSSRVFGSLTYILDGFKTLMHTRKHVNGSSSQHNPKKEMSSRPSASALGYAKELDYFGLVVFQVSVSMEEERDGDHEYPGHEPRSK